VPEADSRFCAPKLVQVLNARKLSAVVLDAFVPLIVIACTGMVWLAAAGTF
jgi:hypothetical protein